jgi:hypothetical protein
LQGLAQLGAVTLFIIPIVFVSVWLSFTSFVVVGEKKRGFAALFESASLARGRWSELVWRMVALMAIFFIVFMIVAGVAGSEIFKTTDTSVVGALVTNAFSNFVLFPLGLAYWYAVYSALRVATPTPQTAHATERTALWLRVFVGIGIAAAIFLALAAMFGWLPQA